MALDKKVMVEIGANVARLQRDMDRSSRIVHGFTSGATSAFKGLGIAIGGYLSYRAVTAGIRGIASIISDVTAAAGEEELAQKKLATALGYTSDALLDQASALQKVTAYGDETVVQAQALIAAFTKSESATMKATEATLDLAAGAGMNLRDAANLVSKTLGSTTNALSRYGITVEGAVGSTARLESFVKNVSRVFGGQAKAEAETYAGKIKQLSNVWGDLKETIGKAITENTFVIEAMRLVKEAIEGMNKALISNKQAFRDFIKEAILFGVDSLITFVEVADKVRGVIAGIGNIGVRLGFFWESIGKSQEETNRLFVVMQEMIDENNRYADSFKPVISRLNEFRAKLAQLKAEQGKPSVGKDAASGILPPGGPAVKALPEDLSVSFDDYYGTLTDRLNEWNDAQVAMTKERKDRELSALEELSVSYDDYYGSQTDIQNEINQIWIDGIEKRKEAEKKFTEDLKDFVVQGFNEMADVVATFVTTGKGSFKEFVNSAIADLTRLIVKMSVFRFLGGIGLGKYLELPYGGGRAAGGSVYPGMAYTVGERGPESFVPAVAGNIVPNQGKAQSIKVEVINKSGTPVKATQGPVRFNFQESVVTVVLDAINRDAYGMRTALGR